MTANLPDTKKETQVDKLKKVLNSESVQQQFKNALADNAPLFVASLIDIYANDTYLQKCSPNAVIMEALKAATLKLPINKSLGFAYIVPYSKSKKVGKEWVKELIPTFQIGYKGYVQLAIRTGLYKYINADVVYEGELIGYDKLTGELDMSGTKVSDEVVGYFAYIETMNGFRKTVYSSKEDVEKHGKKFSKSYEKNGSAWKTDFDAMALKTMIRALFSKYAIMSVEMVNAYTSDADERTPDEMFGDQAREEANQGDVIDVDTGEVVDTEFHQEEQEEAKTEAGPSF